MSRLITANFTKLWKSRVFWVMEIVMVCWSIMMYVDAYIMINQNGRTIDNWNLFFFNDLMFIGVAMAVFTAFYIGVEYSDGTIRNKIAVGHSRLPIYLANLIVCYAAGVIAFLTSSVVSLVMGLLLIGRETVLGLRVPGTVMVIGLFIILAYTGLFVMVAMVDAVKARMALINLILAILLLAMGTLVQLRLQPEYYVLDEETGKTRYITDVGEEIEDTEKVVRNPQYLPAGLKRRLYEWMDMWTPYAQVMHVLGDGEYSVKQPLCMLVWTVVLSGSGIWIFDRKEIN